MKSKRYLIAYGFLGILLLALMLVFGSAPRSALACEPTMALPGYIPPTPIPLETQVASVIQDTQIVLDGTVKTWVIGSDMNSILTVQVERYLKGHGPKTVKISGYFWVCAPNFAFSEGSRAIFFVNGDPSSAEPLQVRTWFDAQDAVAASVRNSTGQEPKTPDTAYNVLWLALLAVAILGLALFLRYRKTRL
ncbi:MAG: hypothetical protein HYZ25_00120 [Chloroflexi bacterium]|nr:hypothetical protein [Chloroflexota bacterium]